jgi:two-component system OmpR family response regulator
MTVKKTSRGRESTGKRNPHHRILVVDDDEDIRRLHTEVLVNSGYKVDAAADGAIAWDALQLNDYDLLLPDHGMPPVNGLHLVKKLRAARMAMPVIMVSGMGPAKELRRHPWLQIDATLLKPYTPRELLATVRNVLYTTNDIAGPAESSSLKNKPSNNFLL